MRGVTLVVLILHAFFAQAHAKDSMDKWANKLADKLVDRVVKVGPLDHADLHDSMLGKPGHLARSAPLRSTALRDPGRSVISQHASLLPSLSHAARTARIPCAAEPDDDPPIWNPFVKKKAKEQRELKEFKAAQDVKRQSTQTQSAETIEAPSNPSGPSAWQRAFSTMVGRLQSVTGAESLEMVKDKGAILVDVRPEYKFDEASVKDAINVPYLVKTKNQLKILVNAALAVAANDANPDFTSLALEKLPQDKPVILTCDRGGILPDLTQGDEEAITNSAMDPRNLNRDTVSLRAAYTLYQAGFKELYFLKGGIDQWARDGFPMVETIADA